MDIEMDPEGGGLNRGSFVTASDAGGGRGAGGAHEHKFRVYNEALVHAATCPLKQCQVSEGRCHKIKASIDHFVRCYGPRRKISPIESCANCSRIWGLLCYHAKHCSTPFGRHCVVAQCDYLREKIARKQQQDQAELERAQMALRASARHEELPVEHRMARLEQDRQQVLQMIAQIRAEKAAAQAAQMMT